MLEQQKMCCCWLPWGKVQDYAKKNCAEIALPALRKHWLQAHRKYAMQVPEEQSRTAATQDIPLQYHERLHSLMNTESFKRTFSSSACQFKMVEIDKIVVLQDIIMLADAERIGASLPEEITMDFLLSLCLEANEPPSQVTTQRVDDNSIILNAENRYFRFLGGLHQSLSDHAPIGGKPVSELSFFFGFSHPAVSVYHFNGRYYMNNGLHRAYALRQRGITHIPAIIMESADLSEFTSYFGLHQEFLLRASRLPVLKDFFDPELTIDLQAIVKRRSIKLSWAIEQSDLPLEGPETL